MRQELDVIIPVFNEGDAIRKVIKLLLDSVKTPFKIFVVYDFDEDTTLPAVKELIKENIPIQLVKNPQRGPHSAVIAGFRASEASSVLVFPADDLHNAARLDAMMAKAKEENAEVVCASRFMRGGKMEGCPWLKAVLVRTANFMLHHLAGLPTHDATNGFRLFSRRVLDTIEVESSVGFSYSIELLVKCHRMGWTISEIPVEWFERSHGQSHFKVIKWLPAYLRWFFYTFQTSFLRLGPETIKRK